MLTAPKLGSGRGRASVSSPLTCSVAPVASLFCLPARQCDERGAAWVSASRLALLSSLARRASP